jgi:hypothetical protein
LVCGVRSGTGAPQSGTDIARYAGYIYAILKQGTGEKDRSRVQRFVGDILARDADKDYHAEKIYFGTAYHSAGWSGKLMSISIPNQDLSGWTPSPSEIKTLFAGGYPFTSSPDAAKIYQRMFGLCGLGKYYSDLDEIGTAQRYSSV